ncbi:hypothetical protein C2W62_30385 [Candidatus Entotheonella serta]|nr:hypothetical protein C2W62_30385 [Candidatus Entotheonella serta]
MSWQELIDQGFIAAGSPDSVAEQLYRLITSLKVGHLVCLLHIGDMPSQKCMASTKLFAEEVMPQLRHHWQSYEDHWSPQPLSAEQLSPPRPISHHGADTRRDPAWTL